eukprot:s3825_g2.t1
MGRKVQAVELPMAMAMATFANGEAGEAEQRSLLRAEPPGGAPQLRHLRVGAAGGTTVVLVVLSALAVVGGFMPELFRSRSFGTQSTASKELQQKQAIDAPQLGGTLLPGPGCPVACGSFVQCAADRRSKNNLLPLQLLGRAHPFIAWQHGEGTIAMATPEEVAIQRQVEQDKVIAWSLQNGIKNGSDLAFFFLHYDEALQEAGRAVADAWQAARADSTQGLAVAARQVMAMGASPPLAVSKPSARPKVRQTADGRAPPFQHLLLRLGPAHQQLARTSSWQSCWVQ